ncbi:hypothetical protein [Microbaculum marinisediminis]|uniref:Uncharacterized protein n=1 Tax=Microbaculum marinisediminis TaxID=2931392 RepID=A0AAW5QZB7_9HYPH|nr:hypothetical protein [Microbaculum sp. A6E488]MCT8971689.1 hypothetical protein [Microbaculum sp. A6E488]
MIDFTVIGPFKLPLKRGQRRLVDELRAPKKRYETSFWREAEAAAHRAHVEYLAVAKGLYVFGLRKGRGTLPYYVGKAAKTKLSTEAFSPRNMDMYNGCLADHNGTPVMYFIVLPRRKGPDNHKVVAQAEKFLIEKAFSRNPDGLRNLQHAKEQRWSIPGVLRSKGKGRISDAARSLGEMIG